MAEEEAEPLATEVVEWIVTQLPRDYAWPGNFRELEQCVRNVLIRGEYRPTRGDGGTSIAELVDGIQEASLSVDELLRRYCTLVYFRTGSWDGAARQLGVDRRTVKAKVDTDLLDRLERES